MAMLRAIRKDHDPFPLFLSSWLAFLRWTDFRCPHCHRIFRRDYLPHKVRLGSGERTCKKCGNVFDDGAREWSELRTNEKIRCLLPVPLVGVLGGALICGALPLLSAPRKQLDAIALEVILGIALLVLLLWLVIRVPQIYRSIYRYGYEVSSMRRGSGVS